jgi:hypothetical protein
MNLLRLFSATALLAASGFATAAEITTNGAGGGSWSDPTTWRGKVLPGADDDVVIRKGDLVVFDRNDDGKVTCQKLLIDPKGAFSFKTNAGKVICCVAGGVETYGAITMDGTRAATDFLELRLVGEEPGKRVIKLLKNGALLVRGKAGLPDARHNIALTAPRFGKQLDGMPGTVEAGSASMIDLQRADLIQMSITANEVDNTGAKPNEKLNVVDNHFTGYSRVTVTRCDTPVISRNTFTFNGPKQGNLRAIGLSETALPEVKNNTIRGSFSHGLSVVHVQDGTIADNVVEMAACGIHVAFGRGSSFGRNVLVGCARGIELHFTDLATLEENAIDGTRAGIHSMYSNSQILGLQVKNVASDGFALVHAADAVRPATGVVTLINCSITPGQVKMEKLPDANAMEKVLVTSMSYLVVGVKDAPAEAAVEVCTANLPKSDQGDLNVRNSPAPLIKGATPLPLPSGQPITNLPLIVKSWSIGPDGKPIAAPEYTIRVLAPADKPEVPRKLLKTVTARPADDWFRAKPDDPKPTLEVSLK